MKPERAWPPCNFRWIVKDRLSVSGLPETPASVSWLRDHGIRLVIHLCKECPPDRYAYQNVGVELYYAPVDDYCAPATAQARLILSKLNRTLDNGGAVHICCHFGNGRAPTVAAMYLVSTGVDAEQALNRMGLCRNFGGYGSPAQRDAVHNLAQELSHRFVVDIRID